VPTISSTNSGTARTHSDHLFSISVYKNLFYLAKTDSCGNLVLVTELHAVSSTVLRINSMFAEQLVSWSLMSFSAQIRLYQR